MAKQQKQPFESTLQDLVYSLDAGSGLQIIRIILLCLFVVGLAAIFTARQFRGFDSEAAMDCAQLGRNLARSHHYVTQNVKPLTIAQVSANTFDGDAKIDFHPEVIRPPVYPAILAGAFMFFDLVGVDLFPTSDDFRGLYPAEQWVIVPLNHFFTMLTGLMLYFLGRNLFSKKIGLLGTLTYFLTAMVWEDSLRGEGLPMLSFFVISAVYFAVLAVNHRRERRSIRNWMFLYLLSGGFSALAFLTHYAALAVIPGIALFIMMMGSRTHRSGPLAFFYLVLVFMVVSPWLVRNYQVCGSPLGLAPHTALIESARYPGDALMRTLNPKFSLLSDFKAVRAKWASNFNSIYQNRLTSMGGGLLITFFMVTYFYRFVRVHVQNLRWGIGASILLFFVGVGFFGEGSVRLYHMFWPFIILYGLAFFSIMLDRLDISIDLYKTGLTGLVVGLTALPLLIIIFLSPSPKNPYPPYYPSFVMKVSELLKPNEVICTDMPWATAWYGNRTSILMPKTLEGYYEINDYRKYISGLYITTITKNRPFVSDLLDGSEKTWFPIMTGRLPKDMPLRHGFQLNNNDQLFLTDSVRWGVGAVTGGAAAEAEE
ncbi:MAG: glycosyltransferase family 39 protein [Kiritimatiellales bacterium]|nr:glycosyltransferase family 39 protein [Kiritimatiellota bacterium]MBL7012370.1 glycosyltransferase family 39 protein [Kiritimatiellales bacterium]